LPWTLPAEGENLVMRGSLVVLTGASGSGKTTLARAVQESCPVCDVLFFDSVGVPSPEKMEAWGEGHQPGGAWQRAMTLAWFARIAEIRKTGRAVLFEGQMRIAFIQEAMRASDTMDAQVILVDCDDATRSERLHGERGQPELADAQMMGWARYLREEAEKAGYEVLDTGARLRGECVELLCSRLRGGGDL
jgi:hypothetical protein